MKTASQLLSWATSLAFLPIAWVTIRDARHHADPAHRWLAGAFGLLAFVSIVGRITAVVGSTVRPVQILTTICFMGSGYALFEYRGTIVGLKHHTRIIVATITALITVAVLAARIPPGPNPALTPTQSAAINAYILLWCVSVLEPSVRFWRAARERPAIEAARLRFLATGFVGIVLVFIIAVAGQGVMKQHPIAQLSLQLFVTAMVPLLAMSVAPPRRLRRRWLRRAGQRRAHAGFAVGIWSWDILAQRTSFSVELAGLYGYAPGNNPTDLELWGRIHPEDQALCRAAADQCERDGRPYGLDFRITRVDGEQRWIALTAEATTDPSTGQVIAIFGTCVDVTDRKHVEQATRDAYEREREAADRLRELQLMKDAVLAGVSHELRTPLTVVLGLARTLRREEVYADHDRSMDLLGRLERSAIRLERLLQDMLDLDRIKRGVLQPMRLPVQLREMVEHVESSAHLLHRDVNILVPDFTVTIDAGKAERIIENLLVNAAKHTSADASIWVRAEQHGTDLLLIVEDSGIGVVDESKQAIFELFRQGEHHASGTGVGLSLVAQFARLHGGRAWVEDRPGGGSSFRVLLADAFAPVPTAA